MNLDPHTVSWLLSLSLSVLVGALGALATVHRDALVGHPWVAIQLQRHGQALDFLRFRCAPGTLLLAQCLVAACMLATWPMTGTAAPVVIAVAALVAPRHWLARAVRARRDAIEGQLVPFLRCLATALHASPSLAEGMRTTATLLPGALSEEVLLALRNHALGTPLAAALSDMARRISNPATAGALLTMQLAQDSGGDLPRVLEGTADTLQEMVRLQGVVRTRTAEGRGQAMLIGSVPLPLLLLVHQIDPGFFAPLWTSVPGQLMAGVAGALWVAAALSARKILAVDI